MKPQLHNSAIKKLFRCGELFRQIIIEGIYYPRSTPLIRGSAIHNTIERDLKSKEKTGLLLQPEEVQEIAIQSTRAEFDAGEILLSEDEKAVGLTETKNVIEQTVLGLTGYHHEAVAPAINFREDVPYDQVERKIVLQTQTKYDIALKIDVDAVDGIHDSKTSTKSSSTNLAAISQQGNLYDFAKKTVDGESEGLFIVDYIWRTPKRGDTKHKRFEAPIGVDQHKSFVHRFNTAVSGIEKGVFLPANPEESYFCSPKFCPAWHNCKYVKGFMQVGPNGEGAL